MQCVGRLTVAPPPPCFQGDQGEVYISADPEDAKVVAGFSLNHMNMRDAGSGKVRSLAAWGRFPREGV